ncbi:unnamed protein product [Timema podura]|uniref:EF-hand domain-containing protein n=1 Tax=Timema podura TaxID=61482 RepID=A0ABN7NIR8_TIMPD|nr:unnamed protein product [Timema podura]
MDSLCWTNSPISASLKPTTSAREQIRPRYPRGILEDRLLTDCQEEQGVNVTSEEQFSDKGAAGYELYATAAGVPLFPWKKPQWMGWPRTNPYLHWKLVFNKYDVDSDGKISLSELHHMIRSESFSHDIPTHAVKQIMEKADRDQNGYLTYEEFEHMVHSEEIQGLFGKSLNRYIKSVVPNKRRFTRGDTQDGSGLYEEQYSCLPPRLLMITISILEIACFLWDVVDDNTVLADGPAAKILMYNPFKRYEAWRFVTYMFVHVGVFHLAVNLIVQIMLGIPLEMVHGWWRVVLVYLAGVVAGSLGTSISDPRVFLAGASGGVYALITAHVASIIMIGYAAHIAGALAGLLVGINILRNLEIKAWERKVWWASMVLFSGLLREGVPRPIIVKFNSYGVRGEVFRKKKLLKGKATTIREDLTVERFKLMQAAISRFEVKSV